MKSLIIIAALFAISTAQVINFGKCPAYKTQEKFEPAKYFTGRFYEHKRFWTIFEVGSKCVHADYSVIPATGHVRVENSGFNRTSGRFSQVGEAYCEKDTPSKCHVRFFPGTPYGDYNILETDYSTYGLVYTCRETLGGIMSIQYAWILTRQKKVSDKEMQYYLSVYKKNGVDLKNFNDVTQDCEDH